MIKVYTRCLSTYLTCDDKLIFLCVRFEFPETRRYLSLEMVEIGRFSPCKQPGEIVPEATGEPYLLCYLQQIPEKFRIVPAGSGKIIQGKCVLGLLLDLLHWLAMFSNSSAVIREITI